VVLNKDTDVEESDGPSKEIFDYLL
jgi:hypothetical protein